ncbi:MAG: site-specific integrase [Chitinophagales bacterium]|nr:site-specific integrase [Chitinophagales bacterium]
MKFYFTDKSTGIKHTVALKCGINYEHTIKGRMDIGKAWMFIILDQLQRDWHPIRDTYPDLPADVSQKKLPHEIWQNKTFCKAINEIFSEKKLSKNSKNCYRLAIDYFEEAATALDLQDVKLIDLKRSTILTIFDAYKLIREAPDKQYNKNLGYIKSLISKACEYAEIENSPAMKIKSLSVPEGRGFIPPTDEEKAIIRQTLEQDDPYFFTYLMVIYYTGIRADETLSLQIRDLDRIKKQFVIIKDDERENAKTDNKRTVPIVDHLWELLERMELHKYPREYFIFGSPGMPGRGWTGVKDKSMYFTPNPTKIKRDTATRRFKAKIKDAFGIECHMYAMKHKGADDKKIAGMKTDAIRGLFGHTHTAMTEKYFSENIHEEEIRRLTPKF